MHFIFKVLSIALVFTVSISEGLECYTCMYAESVNLDIELPNIEYTKDCDAETIPDRLKIDCSTLSTTTSTAPTTTSSSTTAQTSTTSETSTETETETTTESSTAPANIVFQEEEWTCGKLMAKWEKALVIGRSCIPKSVVSIANPNWLNDCTASNLKDVVDTIKNKTGIEIPLPDAAKNFESDLCFCDSDGCNSAILTNSANILLITIIAIQGFLL